MITGKVIELCSTYNHGRFLPAMIDAAFSAVRPPDWLIITDDASTDNSRDILARATAANPRLLVRFNERNRGALTNVEAMLAELDCEYVVLRSADDRDGRQLVAHAVAQLDAHPAAAFYGADAAYYVDDSGVFVPEPAGRPGPARFVAPDRFTIDFGGNLVHGAAVVFRLNALRAVGGFPAELAWHSDWFTILRLAFTHGFVYEPMPGAEVFLDSGSYNSTGTRDLERAATVYRAMLEILRHEPALRSRFREHAVFDLMGDRFRTFATDFEKGAFADLCDRWLEPEIVVARNHIGIHAAVRTTLTHKHAAIAQAPTFMIYGAGRHTKIVLECLAELNLPRPAALVVTKKTAHDSVALLGVPIISLDSVVDHPRTVVLLSSKSYEKEMFELARKQLPAAKIISVWGTYGNDAPSPAGVELPVSVVSRHPLVPPANQTTAEWCIAIHDCDPYAATRSHPLPYDVQSDWGGENPSIVRLVSEFRPDRIIEVGTWKGCSALSMASKLTSLGLRPLILCVDTWGGLNAWLHRFASAPVAPPFLAYWNAAKGELDRDSSYSGTVVAFEQFLSNVVRRSLTERIIPFPMDGRLAAKWFRENGVSAPVIYIDAGHEYDDVRIDIHNYWDLVSTPGLLMGDDFHPMWPGVMKAVHEFATSKSLPFSVEGNTWAIRKSS